MLGIYPLNSTILSKNILIGNAPEFVYIKYIKGVIIYARRSTFTFLSWNYFVCGWTRSQLFGDDKCKP
jgi:hypothetical protein